MVDPQFGSIVSSISGPLSNLASVTPHDTNNLSQATRALYLGTAGNVSVVMAGDATNSPITIMNLTAGVFHPLRVKRVRVTNTSAALIIAGW